MIDAKQSTDGNQVGRWLELGAGIEFRRSTHIQKRFMGPDRKEGLRLDSSNRFARDDTLYVLLKWPLCVASRAMDAPLFRI